MDGSNGKMIELLERIANGLDQTNQRLDATNQRLDQTNQRLDQVVSEMRTGFGAVNARLDNIVDFTGRYFNDHEERIRALEERVFVKSSS